MSDAEAHRPQRAGFTLLELLIVCALLLALTALSWPVVRRSLTRADRDRATDGLCELLREARSQALARGRPMLIQINGQPARAEVFEVGFDQAAASQFGDAASRTQPQREDRPVDLDRATLESLGETQETPLPVGAQFTPIETLKLPSGYAIAFDPPADSAIPVAGERLQPAIAPPELADPEFAESSNGVGEQLDRRERLRLLFDVAGQTGDATMDVVSPDGYATRVVVEGLWGRVRKEPPRKLTPLDQPALGEPSPEAMP